MPALKAALLNDGFTVVQAVAAAGGAGRQADRFEIDFSSPEAVATLPDLVLKATGKSVGGIINALGYSSSSDLTIVRAAAEQTFHVVRTFADTLKDASNHGSGVFVNFTAMGGQFGLDGPVSLAGAGTVGVTKTLKREYPRLSVKSIDIDPQMDASRIIGLLITELTIDDDLIEVGLSAKGRRRPALVPVAPPKFFQPWELEEDAVVMITGGAYGITADVAKAIAQAGKPRLVLVGRSPLPGDEPAETARHEGQALRAAVIDKVKRAGGKVAPASVEAEVKAIVKNRQIRATIAACQAAGSVVEYHALDVRDAVKFGGLIDDLYKRFGRIDGVVHGAGTIEDKRIRDKTPEMFARVFSTKVDSAFTLAEKLRPEGLGFLAFFSSISARFGNVGQIDYAAANEVLNKLADRLSLDWPARVVAFNWGPWEAGMVSDELKRLYESAGMGLLSIDRGVEAFVEEWSLAPTPSAEVLVVSGAEKFLKAAGELNDPRAEKKPVAAK